MSITGVLPRLLTGQRTEEQQVRLVCTVLRTEDAGRNPHLQLRHLEVWGFRQDRYMYHCGLIVMTIMPGWKSGAMENGSSWGHVNRKKY